MTSNASTLETRPFRVEFPQADLDDLRDRLDRTRFAPDGPRRLLGLRHARRRTCATWSSAGRRSTGARSRTRINAHPNFLTEIDEQTIHFIHVRSEVPEARPLLLAHTYPGSVLDYLDLIEPLTDPVAHGGRAEDAFHVVVPSMPGFGFSTPVAAGRLDDGAGRPLVRRPDARPRLRRVRHSRQ